MPLTPANPATDEEEEDQTPQPAPAPKPRIGTTGGVIPEQQSEIDARQPVQWAADPMERQTQVRAEIDKRRQAQFQAEHPFTPSSWRPKINTPETRREDREFEANAEAQFNYNEQQKRAAEIERRRVDTENRKGRNAQLEAQYRGTGQQFYTDSYGDIKPVIDAESKRPLFHATGWEAGTHPQTGAPTLTMRDKYGQRQFKSPPVVQSLDPSDDRMYYKMPDGTTVDAGSIDDFAKHPNYNIAKTALAAKTRQVKAVHQEALQPMKLLVDQSVSQLEDARVEMQSIDQQIEQLSMQVANATGADGSPTPRSEGLAASLGQLQARRDQLDGMVRPRGELAQRAARAKAAYTIASATAMRESYLSQQAEIAARVRAQGGVPENDPIFQANLKGLRSAEQILGGAQQEFGNIQRQPGVAAPVQQPSEPVSTDPLEMGEPYVAAGRGVKNIGSVGIEEFARRYGDGRGPVKASDLIKLQRRSKEIEQTLNNDETTLNQTMRDQFAKEKEYIDSLAKQRFARLPENEQKRVAEISRDPTWWDATKGITKSAAEEAAVGGGGVLKGLAQIMDRVGPISPNGMVRPEAHRAFMESRQGTAKEQMERIKNDPVYRFGNFIQESAQEYYTKGEHENETTVAKALNAAAGAAGGFAPLVASGPAAPLTIGLQTAGSEMERIYDEQVAKGVDPERAAEFAQKRALASGAVQAALFELLPKPLQKAGNKLIVDKIAKGAFSRFIANRTAQGVEGAVMGGGATVAGNVTAGRDATEGAAEGATGLALMQAVAMPRPGGSPQKPKGGAPSEKPAPKTPLTPEQQTAEAAFQKKLAEDSAPAEPPPKPSTAAESAQVFEPALKEKENVPPPSKSAKESAEVMQDVATTEEATAKVASQQEQKAQKLVDRIQELTGKPREEILATRNGREVGEWTKELESEAKYREDPLKVDPDRRIRETKAEIAKLDEEWAQHVEKTAAEAEAYTQIEGDKEKARAQFQATKARHDDLMARRDAIEKQLVEAERVRQSPKGGEDLKKDLAAQEGRPPEPPTAGTTAPIKPVDIGPRDSTVSTGTGVETPAEKAMMEKWRQDVAKETGIKVKQSPLGDQPVRVKLRRGTGELLEVEMPAKMAEKRVNDHIATLDKVLSCLKGLAT